MIGELANRVEEMTWALKMSGLVAYALVWTAIYATQPWL